MVRAPNSCKRTGEAALRLQDRLQDEGCSMSDETSDSSAKRDLPPAAQRALAEAEARRAAEQEIERAREIDGRKGPEPTRYGDWENKGITSDF